MERRKHARVEVKFKVAFAFSGGRTEGDGWLLNLSEGGCAVRGNTRVPEKAMLHLSIYPPGRPSPLLVETAAVRWVRGLEFGLEFVNLSPEQKKQVRTLVEELLGLSNAPSTGPVGTWTA